MANLFVIADYGTSSVVIGLHARDMAGAKRAISWQRQGGFKMPMYICRYEPENQVFVSIASEDKTFHQEAGKRFSPERGAFTESAWLDFWRSLNPMREGTPLWYFFKSYTGAALWSSSDDDGTPLDNGRDDSDIAPETLAQMQQDCERFYWANSEHIHCDGAPVANDMDGSIAARESAMAGHDFWLTRCGHGAGFWDGDWPEPAATALDNAAKAFGNVDLYVGDDGQIYA
ncbi:hypothetical protein [Sinorhizobium meliloti]|uniref:hypothetical protein n=1 Tax=Rhizobium meliloti TaxID=382 RepID=UPI0001E4B025|nr:hypothetical protein [Sinorhizobium meliloti]AEG53164.1 hypothetical protein Sinme_1418 [Sinorhizobium meliloti AK83]MDE4591120.1 hypothetical protein [Sinorhizobium meliloti]SEI56386.1 hypothetical protein SAMN04244575_01067 [Sinorhizobium meliloti]